MLSFARSNNVRFQLDPEAYLIISKHGNVCLGILNGTEVGIGCEEKGQEQIEEQRVIEAKIRIRQQEILDEEERMIKRQEMSSSSGIIEQNETEYFSRAATSSSETEEIVSVPQPSGTEIRHPLRSRENRTHVEETSSTNYEDQEPMYEGEVVLAEQVDKVSSHADETKDKSGITRRQGDLIRKFLKNTANQLTIYGLFSLQEGLKERNSTSYIRDDELGRQTLAGVNPVSLEKLKELVQAYVTHFYPNENDVNSDTELQSWYSEAINVGHADVREANWWPKLCTPSKLIEILTILIWTSSAQHAALNFGQYHFGSYVPNRPPLMRKLIPQQYDLEYASFIADPEGYFLASLPSLFQSTRYMAVIDIISAHSQEEEYLGDVKDVCTSWPGEPKIV